MKSNFTSFACGLNPAFGALNFLFLFYIYYGYGLNSAFLVFNFLFLFSLASRSQKKTYLHCCRCSSLRLSQENPAIR
jgi:hypothetical protein